MLLLKWMARKLKEGNWIIYGNWNMTERWEDVVGPSTLTHGSEARAWSKLVDQMGLVDNCFWAGE